MKKKTFLEFIFTTALSMALNWAIVCCFVKLITLCFGWTFTFPIATGVFFTAWLLRYIFPRLGSK